MRKIIQISAVYVPPRVDRVADNKPPVFELYALCDDGTIWLYSSGFTKKNFVSLGLDPIPQDA